MTRLLRPLWPCVAALAVAACHANGGHPATDAGAGGSDMALAAHDGSIIDPPGTPVDAGGASDGAVAAPDAGGPPAKQSLIWVWQDYVNSLATVAAHASSFTQVSPALYTLNYAYASGAAQLLSSDFDGLSAAQVSQTIHAAKLACIPLIYAGAGNNGTDQGIQNILNDSPAGAQQSFITSMVTEAVDNAYDGYNLDWEVGNTGHDYSAKLVTFLSAFRDALHAKGMTLSLDLGTWYVQQCTGSGGDGFVDFTTLGDSVDWAILEDYANGLGTPGGGCPSGLQTAVQCDNDFASALDVMCDIPPQNVSIGLISAYSGNSGTNPFAGDALQAVTAYGFRAVAIWPAYSNVFLDETAISPSGATWYSLLADYLAQ
ncbi:MAG TPA: hypothetical protein VHB97_14320 [Polyangia bacterium]|nr:hypothetical protein [Polyangia bacterium]